MRPCFAFSAAAANDQPETLSIYDEIGFWGVQAKDFSNSLKAVKSKVLNVEINSPGGDVFAGVAIYNMLKGSGKEIVVKVMGVAASAASLIAMAGDKIIMPKNTMMMVHNPWSFAMGNADELRDTANTLDKIGASLLGTYVAKTGMAEEDMKALLATDTWLTADEALEKGFATEVIEEIKVQAKFDLARAELPENVKLALGLGVKADVTAPTEEELAAAAQAQAEADAAAQVEDTPVAQQISDVAVKAGMPEYAAVWAIACGSVPDVEARIASAREIRAVCAFAKTPDAADAFIKENKSIADVRAALIAAQVEQDDASVIDTSPGSKNKQTAGHRATPKAINTASVWAAHNAQKVKKGS